MISRTTAEISVRPSTPMPRRAAGGNAPMSRVDDDARRGKCEPMLGGEPRHHMGFHIDRRRTGRSVQLPFRRRFGDRGIHTDDRGVACSGDRRDELGRPHRVGGTDCFRFEDGGSDHPVTSAKIRSKTAGNTKADDATIALPGSARGDRRQLPSLTAANNQHAGPGGDLGFERHADKCDDDAMVRKRDAGNPAHVLVTFRQLVCESGPEAMHFKIPSQTFASAVPLFRTLYEAQTRYLVTGQNTLGQGLIDHTSYD